MKNKEKSVKLASMVYTLIMQKGKYDKLKTATRRFSLIAKHKNTEQVVLRKFWAHIHGKIKFYSWIHIQDWNEIIVKSDSEHTEKLVKWCNSSKSDFIETGKISW